MTATLALEPSPTATDAPTHRSVTAHVTGGLDGALRVMTLLRGRRYQVRDFGVHVGEGLAGSRVTCTVLLTAADVDLMLARLRRLPAVVSAVGEPGDHGLV
jgi:hypothetical protein